MWTAGTAAFQNAKTPKIKLDFAMFSSQPENVRNVKILRVDMRHY